MAGPDLPAPAAPGPVATATPWLAWAILLAALALHGAFQARGRGGQKDLLDMYLQTREAMAGRGPYDAARVREAYETFYRERGTRGDIPPGGFFYPPIAMLLLAPVARLPWPEAQRAWPAFLTAMAVACGALAWTFGRRPGPHATAGAAIVAFLLLDPLTQTAISLGQSAMVIAGGVALGGWAYERGRRWLGAAAWALATIKPHLAIPFLALAPVLGGWRRLVEVALLAAALNVLGCLVTAGTPAILASYPGHLRNSHLALGYNRVVNDQVVGWNRVVYALGGPEIELRAPSMLACYAVWGALIFVRGLARPGPGRPRFSTPYLLAAAAAGALLCAQAKGYDLVLLVLFVPLLFRLWDLGRRAEAALVLAVIAATGVPRALVLPIASRLPEPELLLSYRAFVVAALGLYLLIRGDPESLSPGRQDATESPRLRVSA